MTDDTSTYPKYDAVMLLSGGLDSTVLAYWLKNRGYSAIALTFDYGQKARKELRCAEWVAKQLGFEHEVIKLPKTVFQSSSLLVNGQGSTVVPNRNMILLSIAVGYALSRHIYRVYIATHRNDWETYPDCRPEFYQALNLALMIGNDLQEPVIHTPFLYKSKADIVAIGHKLGVPFEKTWTCYEGQRKPCGKCSACVERKMAFEMARIEDPLWRR